MLRTEDYKLSDREFERLRALVLRHTAIELNDSKRQLVYSRFSKRLRALGLTSFSQYCDRIDAGDTRELDQLASAITTKFTRFFRESHHFEFLAGIARQKREQKRLRIWSAGCATGEEPYSIAMTLCDAIGDIDDWDIRILATDVDTQALHVAAGGVFPEQRVSDMESGLRKRWFLKGRNAFSSHVKIANKARELIRFKALNLTHAWPMRSTFDVIFCRNVMIYFGKSTKVDLVRRFAGLQREGDFLIVGHAENLHKISDLYRLVGDTVYQRCLAG